jgi:hypothetical protein
VSTKKIRYRIHQKIRYRHPSRKTGGTVAIDPSRCNCKWNDIASCVGQLTGEMFRSFACHSSTTCKVDEGLEDIYENAHKLLKLKILLQTKSWHFFTIPDGDCYIQLYARETSRIAFDWNRWRLKIPSERNWGEFMAAFNTVYVLHVFPDFRTIVTYQMGSWISSKPNFHHKLSRVRATTLYAKELSHIRHWSWAVVLVTRHHYVKMNSSLLCFLR